MGQQLETNKRKKLCQKKLRTPGSPPRRVMPSCANGGLQLDLNLPRPLSSYSCALYFHLNLPCSSPVLLTPKSQLVRLLSPIIKAGSQVRDVATYTHRSNLIVYPKLDLTLLELQLSFLLAGTVIINSVKPK